MFSPDMMAAAQKMMANMKPDDMQRMSQMASNMDPTVMENMMKGMGGNVPSGVDTKQAVEQMKNMTPEQLQQGMSQAQTQMSAQKQYYYNAAEMLKNEGNKFVKDENYTEALGKYSKALENLKGHVGAEVDSLSLGLLNNSALCHLKGKAYKEAVKSSEEALKVDPKSFKAYYRRGQAKAEMGNFGEAVSDVRRASELSPTDKAIASELKRLREVLKDKGIKEEETPLEVKSEWSTDVDSSGSASRSSSSSAPAPGGADGTRWAAAAEKLAENPDMLKQATEAMSSMSSGELEKLMANTPLPPGMDAATMKSSMESFQKNPDMLKNAMSTLQSIPEDERKKMMAQRYGAAGAAAAAAGTMATSDGGKPDMSKMFDNPEMIQQAAEMTKNLSEEDLKRMNINSPEEADMMRKAAEQMAADPNLTKQMSEMMKNMGPEQMESMMEMSRSMGGMGGMGGGGGMPGGMAGMMAGMGGGKGGMDPSAMMSDPDMMKATEQMMSSMSPEMLASMAKASGMDISEDKAKMVARFLPLMMRLMRWFGYLKKGWNQLWTRNGRIGIAVFVLAIAYYQHSKTAVS